MDDDKITVQMHVCVICRQLSSEFYLCPKCTAAYDRWNRKQDTTWHLIKWVADRVWREAKKHYTKR